MSFICKICGPIKNGQRQYKIATKIRQVGYNLQVKTIYANKETIKTVKKTNGQEIVEETTYCHKHVPRDDKPQIVDKVTRNQLINVIMKIKIKAGD